MVRVGTQADDFQLLCLLRWLTATARSARSVTEKPRAPTSVLPVLITTANAAGLGKPVLDTVPAPNAPSPARGWHPHTARCSGARLVLVPGRQRQLCHF